MNITSVDIYWRNKENDSLKALAKITFDNEFTITGIKIIEGKKGLFISMPQTKNKDEYFDICYPVTKEFRTKITESILNMYSE